jgi:hypothetical protein
MWHCVVLYGDTDFSGNKPPAASGLKYVGYWCFRITYELHLRSLRILSFRNDILPTFSGLMYGYRGFRESYCIRLQPWIWRQYISPKLRYWLKGVTTQKTTVLHIISDTSKGALPWVTHRRNGWIHHPVIQVVMREKLAGCAGVRSKLRLIYNAMSEPKLVC